MFYIYNKKYNYHMDHNNNHCISSMARPTWESQETPPNLGKQTQES